MFGVDITQVMQHIWAKLSQSLRDQFGKHEKNAVFSRGSSICRNNHTEMLKDIISRLRSASRSFLPGNSTHQYSS